MKWDVVITKKINQNNTLTVFIINTYFVPVEQVVLPTLQEQYNIVLSLNTKNIKQLKT